jgi:hypothetical protein
MVNNMCYLGIYLEGMRETTTASVGKATNVIILNKEKPLWKASLVTKHSNEENLKCTDFGTAELNATF